MYSIEELIIKTEQLIVARTGKKLIFIQKAILKAILSEPKQTYAEIAQKFNYSEGYIKKIIAPQLWQLLSQILQEKVNKNNCRSLLEQKFNNSSSEYCYNLSKAPGQFTLELPDGYVPLSSPFYIERADLESICYQEVSQPGAFLRIKAPKKMGKTSLAMRIIAHGTFQNYQTAYLSVEQVETVIFNSTSKFLRWFCANLTQQWDIESKLDDYWDEDMGALMSCTIYFQEYVLKQLSHPAILVIDEVERVFEHSKIAHDFLTLLRFWHEKGKDIILWQKLRLVIINSTDVYLSLKTNRSPFNVGLSINLPLFCNREIEELAQRHRIKLNTFEREELIELTGGFPHLVRLTLYESIKQNIPLATFLEDAINKTEIFNQQLHYLLWNLQQHPKLQSGFQQVLQSSTDLATEVVFKLTSLGLVRLKGNKAIVSCGLYEQYFSRIFVTSS